jgi:hypothetical protein
MLNYEINTRKSQLNEKDQVNLNPIKPDTSKKILIHILIHISSFIPILFCVGSKIKTSIFVLILNNIQM